MRTNDYHQNSDSQSQGSDPGRSPLEDPESVDVYLYRWVLIPDDDLPDLLHPETGAMTLPSECGEKEETVILFKEEDYFERGEEGFAYSGLVFLDQDEDEPDVYHSPGSFRCRRCGYGTAFPNDSIEDHYQCERCHADYLVFTRPYLLNAAVLLLWTGDAT